MKPNRAIFPILVFLGGCSYGPSSSVIKLGYADGFTPLTFLFAEYFTGLFLLLIIAAALIAYAYFRHGRTDIWNIYKPYTPADKTSAPGGQASEASAPEMPSEKPRGDGMLRMFACGLSLALVSTCYIVSLNMISASLAVLLLFQFTWMGVILEAVIKRRFPSRNACISVIILISGTVLASGILGGIGSMNPIGVIFGLGSAFFYTINMYLLGDSKTEMHPFFKSLTTLLFACVAVGFIFGPMLIGSGGLNELLSPSLIPYALMLGIIGCALPVSLFSIGMQRLPLGFATTLSSSELPASIICAVLIINETVMWYQWIGIVILLYGTSYRYMFVKGRKKPVIPFS
ncbi:MAG: EamA family transporter [Methanomicrobium sp.]|nr:EamA family transporter [Methanomicrobium sp.]